LSLEYFAKKLVLGAGFGVDDGVGVDYDFEFGDLGLNLK